MPIDIAILRNDPDKVRESQKKRFASVELVDECIALDNEWRAALAEKDGLAVKVDRPRFLPRRC